MNGTDDKDYGTRFGKDDVLDHFQNLLGCLHFLEVVSGYNEISLYVLSFLYVKELFKEILISNARTHARSMETPLNCGCFCY